MKEQEEKEKPKKIALELDRALMLFFLFTVVLCVLYA